MTIIVGRGRSKATQRIEISDPTVSREHCWLTDNGDGSYTLENKSAQGTCVDGRKVVKTRVLPETLIQLSETTTVRVADLIPAPSASPVPNRGGGTNATGAPAPEFSVRGLEAVWQQYHDARLELQRKQHSMGLVVRIPMICSAVTGVLSGVLPEEFRVFTIILTLLGVCVMVYGFIQQKNFVFAEEMDKLERWFQDNYICPNPRCGHFMGNQAYNILRQDRKCRYCGCKLNEK